MCTHCCLPDQFERSSTSFRFCRTVCQHTDVLAIVISTVSMISREDADGNFRRVMPDKDHLIYDQPGHLIRRLQQIAVALFMAETKEFDITPIQYAALLA